MQFCIICGEAFERKSYNQKTCSKSCSYTLRIKIINANHKRRYEESQNAKKAGRKCQQCGSDIPTERTLGAIFCTPKCKRKHRIKITKERYNSDPEFRLRMLFRNRKSYARIVSRNPHYAADKRKRERSTPHGKLKKALSQRLYDMVRRGEARKHDRAINLLGCSVSDFKKHIESKFIGRMCWENYGKAWHIDHIIPCSSFDLTDEKQQKICFHFTNLRPLWARSNIRKGNKMVNPQMSLMI